MLVGKKLKSNHSAQNLARMKTDERGNEQLFAKLLNIHFIVWEIASNLSFQDLVNCTAVNSLFYCKFREYLRDKRTCNIHIRWDNSPCLQLKELNDLLNNSTTVIPYNGISCSDEDTFKEACTAGCHENIGLESFQTLLSKVKFTSFLIFMKDLKPEELKCPSYLFMQYVLKFKALEIRTINFLFMGRNCVLWEYFGIEEETRPTWFSNVHTFNLIGGGYYAPLHIQEILESCPNLKRLTGRFGSFMMAPRPKNLGPPESYPRNPMTNFGWTGDEMVFRQIPPFVFGLIPKDKYKCITDCYDLSPSQLLSLASEYPKLKTLSLLLDTRGELPWEQNYDGNVRVKIYDVSKTALALRSLFLSSWNSLEKLICSERQLLMIQEIIEDIKLVSSLSRLSTLELTSGNSHEREAYLFLRCIDFSRIFPRLTHVCLNPSANCEVVDSSVLSNAGEYSNICSTVRSLVCMDYITEKHLQIVASVFPEVQDFEYHRGWKTSEMCTSLWNAGWKKLKSVKFCFLKIDFDLDDNFFGLPPEEREFIENQNLDVEKLEHVSSKNSALNGIGLNRMRLEFIWQDFSQPLTRSFLTISPLTVQRIKMLPAFTLEIIIIITNRSSSPFNRYNSPPIFVYPGTTFTMIQDVDYSECEHKHTRLYNSQRNPDCLKYIMKSEQNCDI